jgi:superoxide dismutase, Cu-Zn family
MDMRPKTAQRQPRRLAALSLAVAATALVYGCDTGDPTDQQAPRPGEVPDPQVRSSAPPPATPETQAAARDTAPDARAVLEPVGDSSVRGTVAFTEQDGSMHIVATIMGLNPGRHGLHLHENGDCASPGAESAGDHFSPSDDPHGAPTDAPRQHHAGDLGNVSAPFGGVGLKQIDDPELTLDGELGVVGRAVIVHGGADDLETQPSGNSGDPVACGVVRLTEDAQPGRS